MITPAGIIPALITPFTEQQQLDENALRRTVSRVIADGVHGLFALGTNGEFFTLTHEEKLNIVRIVVDEAAGRVPVFAGTGGIGTEETIRLTREMEHVGIAAVSVITPFFLSFTQAELERHYRRLAAATSLPMLLYNIPGRTGNHLQPATVARLAEEPNIVGIKDSSGNFDVILQYIERTAPPFSVLSGTDLLILPSLLAGGRGAVASTANFIPRTVAAIYEHWKQGDMEAAWEAQRLLRPICDAFELGTLPSVLKEALHMAGFPSGPPRDPVERLNERGRQQLRNTIDFYVKRGLIAPLA